MDSTSSRDILATSLDSSTCTIAEFDWERGFPLNRCPNGRGEILLSRTGELVHDSCRGNRCRYCSRVKAQRLRDAIAASKPSSFWTLTRVGAEWRVTHERVRRLRERLGASHYEFEWVWVVEDVDDVQHVHALVHGHAPTRSALSQYAQRAGMGATVDVTPIRRGSDSMRVAAYLLKGVSSDHERHLALNGGQRLVHATRRFWRRDDRPLGSMREAMAAAGRHSWKQRLA